MLTALGATPDEDQVYGHLVTAVTASETELAAGTGLSAEQVRTALASLIDRGLASRTPDSPARFVAASPSVVEGLISERLGELRSAQATLDRLATQYRANGLAQAATGVFEIVRGTEALRRVSIDMLNSASAEVLNMIKPPVIAVQPEDRYRPPASARSMVIFETQALEHPGNLDAIKLGMRSHDEARVHTRLPIKMLAVDRKVALLPLAQQDTTPIGVLVHESAVLDAFLALFEYVWATAVPLHVDSVEPRAQLAASVLSDEGRRLLSLLLSGLTDEAIAVHQGTSVRTVQRKVQALMTVAHVRTRMQLAWEAARQGWM